jgi:hypothetical protein
VRPGVAACLAGRLVERVDGWAGQGIEAGVGRHHRRRLRRVGRVDQLDPPHGPVLWAAGDPPPRAGAPLDVLVDGGQALPRIASSGSTASPPSVVPGSDARIVAVNARQSG